MTQPPDLDRLLSQAGALMREQEKNTGYSLTVAKLGRERIVRVEAAP